MGDATQQGGSIMGMGLAAMPSGACPACVRIRRPEVTGVQVTLSPAMRLQLDRARPPPLPAPPIHQLRRRDQCGLKLLAGGIALRGEGGDLGAERIDLLTCS